MSELYDLLISGYSQKLVIYFSYFIGTIFLLLLLMEYVAFFREMMKYILYQKYIRILLRFLFRLLHRFIPISIFDGIIIIMGFSIGHFYSTMVSNGFSENFLVPFMIGYQSISWGILHGFFTSDLLSFTWTRKEIKKLKMIYPFTIIIGGISIIHELLTYTYKPYINIPVLSQLLNGIGVWGTIGIIINTLLLSINFLYKASGESKLAKFLDNFSIGINVFGLYITILSSINHINLLISDIFPFFLFNFFSYTIKYYKTRFYISRIIL